MKDLEMQVAEGPHRIDIEERDYRIAEAPSPIKRVEGTHRSIGKVSMARSDPSDAHRAISPISPSSDGRFGPTNSG